MKLTNFTKFYDPHISINHEQKNYTFKTASSLRELAQVFELRSHVFAEEYGITPSTPVWDIDDYDQQADHLVIIHRETNTVIGTYRLLHLSYSDHFYSESQFNLDHLQLNESFLELGRACIDPKHRNGITLTLLWKGILAYASKIGATNLMGCASFKLSNIENLEEIHSHFRAESFWADGDLACPLEDYSTDDNYIANYPKHIKDRDPVPALLRLYFKAGAKIASHPALDKAFNCIDYLTLIDLKEMKPKFESKLAPLIPNQTLTESRQTP